MVSFFLRFPHRLHVLMAYTQLLFCEKEFSIFVLNFVRRSTILVYSPAGKDKRPFVSEAFLKQTPTVYINYTY